MHLRITLCGRVHFFAFTESFYQSPKQALFFVYAGFLRAKGISFHVFPVSQKMQGSILTDGMICRFLICVSKSAFGPTAHGFAQGLHDVPAGSKNLMTFPPIFCRLSFYRILKSIFPLFSPASIRR
jgi:hypothetical protein